ncbi:histone-fold-containing protein [Xylaria sp. CBS 124048]|nr:histone-fold-containing protein [Xylaria sp. CBS 124048]
MPYNTTAIPPRKEVTGQALLPLSRVKKIVAQDPDIKICSNNAAFVITLATEMFIQYLAGEGLNMAKLERKPRRNIQYKDLANAVSHQEKLEFLQDIIPKTYVYRLIKDQAAATRLRLSGGASLMSTAAAAAADEDSRPTASQPNGKKHKGGRTATTTAGGSGSIASFVGPSIARIVSADTLPVDPVKDAARRAAAGDEDVEMAD